MRFLLTGVLAPFFSVSLWAQEGATPVSSFEATRKAVEAATLQEGALEYICPMDPDIRSKTPGVCSRCGMKLVAGVPVLREYPVRVSTRPAALKPGEKIQLNFAVGDPETLKPIRDFEIVHEKLFHLFVISQDLSFFAHEHPEMQADGSFQIDWVFPKPGMYRVLSDFYPAAGTPQLVERTLLVPGLGFKLAAAKLDADVGAKESENLEVELSTDPREPVAGMKTLLFFRLRPNQGLEPLLGAMGHMLAASSDLIDLIHTHPVQVTESTSGPYTDIQFNVIFPRAGVHRVWVQFQRKGVVNTVAFNIPVVQL
ncbi:MAG TPA: heavy metal-binding domain-containing protein, partial [Bryobacteraceae bacterium]|nr:heavy metal-binding domain-containing protein [Bryobacteraceae bacterium]